MATAILIVLLASMVLAILVALVLAAIKYRLDNKKPLIVKNLKVGDKVVFIHQGVTRAGHVMLHLRDQQAMQVFILNSDIGIVEVFYKQVLCKL